MTDAGKPSDQGEPGSDESLQFMLGRIRTIADEWIDAYASLAKEGVRALTGQAADRETWAKDAWSTWATLGGRTVEASYLSAVIADRLRTAATPNASDAPKDNPAAAAGA